MNKFNYLKTLLGLILLITIFVGCSNSNEGESTLGKFKQAVEENDAEALYELVEIKDGTYWSAKEAQDVIDNYERIENNYSIQIELFEEQLEAIDKGEPVNNEKNKFYFDDDGKLHLRGYEFYLDGDQVDDAEEIVFTVNDAEEIVVESPFDDEIIIGVFGPGDYDIKAIARYGEDTVDAYATIEMSSVDYQKFKKEAILNLKGQSVRVTSSIPNILVMKDGKQVDEIVDNGEISRVKDGVELQGVQKASWGKIVSETVVYTNSAHQPYDITPSMFTNEKDKKEITRVINDFYDKLYKSLSEDDKSILADVHATNEVKDSHDHNFDSIEGNNLNSYFGGEVNKTTVDFGNVRITEDGLLEVNADIYTNFKFFITKHDEPKRDEMRYQFKTIQLDKQPNGDWRILNEEGSFYGSDEPNLSGEYLLDIEDR